MYDAPAEIVGGGAAFPPRGRYPYMRGRAGGLIGYSNSLNSRRVRFWEIP